MVYLSVCIASFPRIPEHENELALKPGELILILEKDIRELWWKAEKITDDEEEDHRIGLIPWTHVAEVRSEHNK